MTTSAHAPLDGVWSAWPLSEYHFGEVSAVGFNVPLSSGLSPEIQAAIKACPVFQQSVAVCWSGDKYSVVEIIKPLELDELEDLGRDSPGGLMLHSLEIVIGYEFLDDESDTVEKWLDSIADVGGAAAKRDFPGPPSTSIFGVEDSRSTLPCAVVLFSIGPVGEAKIHKNRADVFQWAESVFLSLVHLDPVKHLLIN